MKVTLRALVAAAAIAGAVPFGVLAVLATPDVTTEKRSEGEDLYHRGLYPEAIAWWTEHAAQGDTESARRLGVEDMDGKGNVVERDYDKARTYHMQAARAGDPRSMFDLGTIYEHGLGVQSDLAEAAHWYEWSAKYGFPQGQYNFATMLELGDGGRKDEVEAYMYYYLAALHGVGSLPYDSKKQQFAAEGENPMQQLGHRLSRAQIADAKARAKAFKPLSGPMPI
jgi:TPR repeat protein